MKKKIILFASIASSMLMFAQYASAHERDTFKIGDKTYTFVVGSLAEPVVVDDKAGVDFHLTEGGGMPTMSPDGGMDGPPSASAPVTGAEKTLKVEVSAGDKKKTFDFSPAWGQAGVYHAVFYPTVETTYNYRIFGTLNNIPVNLAFTCIAGEVSESSEDKTVMKLSDQVTRTDKVGGFGCPEAKSKYGFPEATPTSYELSQKVDAAAANAANSATGANSMGTAGIVLGILGVVLGGLAIVKGKKSST